MAEQSNNDITVFVVSEKQDEKTDEFVKMLRRTCGEKCNLKVFLLINPLGVGLTTIYSSVMEKEDISSEVIIYMHDDIDFLKNGWGDETLRLFKENKDYGIIGVAGSAEFDENGAWWNYNKKYGQVLHRNDGKVWLTTFSPLLDHDLEEVCVIDGLFMAVDRKRITKNFDKGIDGFDFYDIDFCLANYFDGKTKIGVTTNIRIAHNSIGKLKKSWYSNRDKINKKYMGKFPISISKK